MCISVTVYFPYLRIHKFVWAHVLCGTRYYQSASLDCSGTIQKIHMREIRWDQGSGMMMKLIRRTCFREEYYIGMRRYYWGREDCRPRPMKTMYARRPGFSLIFLDASIRLGSRFVWYKNRVLCFSGLHRGHQHVASLVELDAATSRNFIDNLITFIY